MSDFEIKTNIIEMIEIHKLGLDTENFNTLNCLMQRLDVERRELRELREQQDLQDLHERDLKQKIFIESIVSTVQFNTKIITNLVITFASYIWLLMRMLYVLMRVLYTLSKAVWITTTTIIGAVINGVMYIRLLLAVKPPHHDVPEWVYDLTEDYVTAMIINNANNICNDDDVKPELFYDCIDQTPIINDVNPVNEELQVYDVVFYKLENNHGINIQKKITLKIITEEPVKRVNNKPRQQRVNNKPRRKREKNSKYIS